MGYEHVTIDSIMARSLNQTMIHPFALAFTLLMGIMMLLMQRKYMIIPFFLTALFITGAQRVVVLSLDITMLRILMVFGWIRILAKGEYKFLKLNAIDKMILLWALSGIIIYTMQWKTPSAFIYRLGAAFDIVGMYFLFRTVIRNYNDFFIMITTLLITSIPLAMMMLIERGTGRNVFSIFGGVPRFTDIRAGRLRCQGAFGHPILAGTYGATLIPIFIGMWGINKRRFLIVLGIISATIITVTSASSGPILSYLSGLIAISLWPFRKNIRIISFGLVSALIFLQLIMKAPVYALVLRFSIVSGSTAWHRYNLIDQFVKRFNEWWLLGTKYTDHWGYFLFDITNHYIRMAIDGGLLTLLLFIIIIFLCFRSINKYTLVMENTRSKQFFLWAIKSTLFAHLISFMSVSYFDQIIVVWFFLISMISTFYDYTRISKERTDKLVA